MINGVLQNALAVFSFISVTLLPQTVSATGQNYGYIPLQKYIYVAQEGESLTGLAEKYYGVSDYWTTIWNDNPGIINPSVLTPGFPLLIRYKKPEHFENVSGNLMARLMSLPNNPPLDDNIAFAKAETSSSVKNPEAVQNNAVEVTALSPAPPSGYDDFYKAAGEKFNVPWQILYGIHLTETGLRNGAIVNKSGSGARGPMQFMPSTFKSYAVDGDGDGVPNIDNAVDAIYTAANYISRHGSIQQALISYGGNIQGTLDAACSKGYCL